MTCKSFPQWQRLSALPRTVANGCGRLRTWKQRVANKALPPDPQELNENPSLRIREKESTKIQFLHQHDPIRSCGSPSVLPRIALDRFGNYIVQRAISGCRGHEQQRILQLLVSLGPRLRRTANGRHIMCAVPGHSAKCSVSSQGPPSMLAWVLRSPSLQ